MRGSGSATVRTNRVMGMGMKKQVWLALGFAGLLCSVFPARADFQSVTATGDPNGVFQTRTNRITIRWAVRVQFPFPPNSSVDQVGSHSLVLGIPSGNGCQQLQVDQRTISGSITLQNLQGSTVLTEEVTITPALVMAARKQGGNAIAFCRTFQESLSPNTYQARLTLPIRSGGIDNPELSLEYIRLRFDDGSVSRVVPTGAALLIHAEVRYSGRGLLRAVWEVADPATTRGTPVYRPLQHIQRNLSAGGRENLVSTLLPTQISGLHMVRLRVLQPAIEAPGLVLRYFVQGASNQLPGIGQVRLLRPAPGSVIGIGEKLEWAPVAGAAAYRVEFLGSEGGMETLPATPPSDEHQTTAAQLVPAKEAGATLSPSTLGRMGTETGFWRVVALDDSGRRLAVSEWRFFIRRGDGGGKEN